MATELYEKIVSYNYRDEETTKAVREAWRNTPWVINVRDFSHSPGSWEWFDFVEWANGALGAQSCLWNDHKGDWYRASGTVNGLTNYGFSTEAKMRAFMARYPNRVGAD